MRFKEKSNERSSEKRYNRAWKKKKARTIGQASRKKYYERNGYSITKKIERLDLDADTDAIML